MAATDHKLIITKENIKKIFKMIDIVIIIYKDHTEKISLENF